MRPEAILRERYGTPRPGQVDAADFVFHCIANRQHAALEMPTGSGKSGVAVSAACAYAKQTGKRVIIATNTIALQRQLQDDPHFKGLPIALFMGRGRYLCTAKAEQKLGRVPLDLETETDWQARYAAQFPDVKWSEIRATRECCGGECPIYCAHRKRAWETPVVITNHHMVYFHAYLLGLTSGQNGPEYTDAGDEGAAELSFGARNEPYHLLGENIGAFICDEGDALPDVVRSVNSSSLTENGARRVLGILRKHDRSLALEYEQALRQAFADRPDDTLLLNGLQPLPGLVAFAHCCARAADALPLADDDTKARLMAMVAKAGFMATETPGWIRYRDEEGAYRVEPYDSGWLVQRIANLAPIVLMSATLRHEGTFAALKHDVGLNLQTHTTAPVLDYSAAIPVRSHDTTEAELAARYPYCNGPALVLCASKSRVRAVASFANRQGLAGVLEQDRDGDAATLIKQGKERARTGAPCLLIGTKSLAVGADVSPRLLFIDKLPYDRPTEPRYLYANRLGQNSWPESARRMQTTLKQSIGRLIRKNGDSGEVIFAKRCFEGRNPSYNVRVINDCLKQIGFKWVIS